MKNYVALLIAFAVGIAGIAYAQPKEPPGDACKLLTDAEVRVVFPNAKPAKRDTSVDKYGIASCIWEHPGGRFAVQLMKAAAKIDDEMRGRLSGNLDPLKPRGANDAVRIVTVSDVGDAARAFVEPTDQKRGVVQGVAMLIAQRSGNQIILMSDQLPERERGAALKALEDLGRAAVKRL